MPVFGSLGARFVRFLVSEIRHPSYTTFLILLLVMTGWLCRSVLSIIGVVPGSMEWASVLSSVFTK